MSILLKIAKKKFLPGNSFLFFMKTFIGKFESYWIFEDKNCPISKDNLYFFTS